MTYLKVVFWHSPEDRISTKTSLIIRSSALPGACIGLI